MPVIRIILFVIFIFFSVPHILSGITFPFSKIFLTLFYLMFSLYLFSSLIVLLPFPPLLFFHYRDCDDEDTGGSETITNYFNGTFVHTYVHAYVHTFAVNISLAIYRIQGTTFFYWLSFFYCRKMIFFRSSSSSEMI